jgi:anti-sigma B factor antagonist
MNLDRTNIGQVTVLRLEGDLDEGGVDKLREGLYACIADGRFCLVLNFSEVRFVSYMGVGVLVERLRKLRASNGDIKLVGINLYTERLFRMIGVTSLFEIYDSESRAIAVYKEAA